MVNIQDTEYILTFPTSLPNTSLQSPQSLLQIKPTPDWKGGAARPPQGGPERKRSPGKRVSIKKLVQKIIERTKSFPILRKVFQKSMRRLRGLLKEDKLIPALFVAAGIFCRVSPLFFRW